MRRGNNIIAIFLVPQITYNLLSLLLAACFGEITMAVLELLSCSSRFLRWERFCDYLQEAR